MKRILLATTTAVALFAAPALADTASGENINTVRLNEEAKLLPTGAEPMVDIEGRVFFGDENYKRVPSQEITLALVNGIIAYDKDEVWVGELDTIMVTPTDRVVGAIIDVGGFLGVGEKEVAIAIEDMTVLHNSFDNKTQVVINASKSDLEAMPEYDR